MREDARPAPAGTVTGASAGSAGPGDAAGTVQAAGGRDPLAEAVGALGDLRVRGCLGRPATARERLAQILYERLHPMMAALGLLFLVAVLSQAAAADGSALHTALLVTTWLLWAVFAAEYVLRLVIAPSTGAFLRRTWWQLVFLLVPFLSMVRGLLFLRAARSSRVVLAALRGTRSARATLTDRTAWLAVVTTIVVFTGADLLYRLGGVEPYGAALHGAALAAITGEPTPGDTGLAQVLDVVLALYAVVFFASLAGILGAYFLEHRAESRATSASVVGPEDGRSP